MMSPDEQDRELSRLYQQTTGDGSPPQLDQRVLETAQALAPQRRVWFRHNWMPALSAVLVLGLAIPLLIPSADDPGILPVAPQIIQEYRLEERLEERVQHSDAGHSESEPYDTGIQSLEQLPVRTAKKSEFRALQRAAETVADEAEVPSATMLSADPELRESSNAAAGAALPDRATTQIPPAWLLVIEALLDNNQAQAAHSEFLKFRQVYPDYDVDQALLQRLAELD